MYIMCSPERYLWCMNYIYWCCSKSTLITTSANWQTWLSKSNASCTKSCIPTSQKMACTRYITLQICETRYVCVAQWAQFCHLLSAYRAHFVRKRNIDHLATYVLVFRTKLRSFLIARENLTTHVPFSSAYRYQYTLLLLHNVQVSASHTAEDDQLPVMLQRKVREVLS